LALSETSEMFYLAIVIVYCSHACDEWCMMA